MMTCELTMLFMLFFLLMLFHAGTSTWGEGHEAEIVLKAKLKNHQNYFRNMPA